MKIHCMRVIAKCDFILICSINSIFISLFLFVINSSNDIYNNITQINFSIKSF